MAPGCKAGVDSESIDEYDELRNVILADDLLKLRRPRYGRWVLMDCCLQRIVVMIWWHGRRSGQPYCHCGIAAVALSGGYESSRSGADVPQQGGNSRATVASPP